MIPKVQLAPDYSISQLIAGGWQLQKRSDDAIEDSSVLIDVDDNDIDPVTDVGIKPTKEDKEEL